VIYKIAKAGLSFLSVPALIPATWFGASAFACACAGCQQTKRRQLVAGVLVWMVQKSGNQYRLCVTSGASLYLLFGSPGGGRGLRKAPGSGLPFGPERLSSLASIDSRYAMNIS
jgi:hypothetical protein